MPLSDDEAAQTALSTLTSLSPAQQVAQETIITILKTGNEDSFIDVHQLFALYNTLYFRSLLSNVEVIWSARLTLCAGICELSKDPVTKKWSRIRLKLSEPLLKLRPRSDLVNTLLHECIHAYFFVTSSFKHSRDPDGGHGPGFHALAKGINSHGGYAITEFHEFHDEVDSYRTHVWVCDGSCVSKPPFFGLVKRSMNRPPGKSDTWWEKHKNECAGMFTKIAEPEMTKAQVDKLSSLQRAGRQKNKLDNWVAPSTTSKRARSTSPEAVVKKIACPICGTSIKDIYINEHLDKEHSS